MSKPALCLVPFIVPPPSMSAALNELKALGARLAAGRYNAAALYDVQDGSAVLSADLIATLAGLRRLVGDPA